MEKSDTDNSKGSEFSYSEGSDSDIFENENENVGNKTKIPVNKYKNANKCNQNAIYSLIDRTCIHSSFQNTERESPFFKNNKNCDNMCRNQNCENCVLHCEIILKNNQIFLYIFLFFVFTNYVCFI